MKLYYAPGACSLSPHIVAREAGLPLQLVRVDTKTHRIEGGRDFYEVNPRGYVPVLEMDDGALLREGSADRAVSRRQRSAGTPHPSLPARWTACVRRNG